MACIVLLQLVLFVIAVHHFSRYFIYLYGICVVISVLVSIWIANSKSKLPYKIAWIIPILAFPLFGGLAFFLLGGYRNPSRKHALRHRTVFRKYLSSPCQADDLQFLGMDVVQQSKYLQNTALCPLYSGTATRYFSSGEAFFPVLLEALEQAQRYILLEYFIISEGEMWGQILEILNRKVAAGVDVRIIYDDLGSVITLPHHYHEHLEQLGIQCCVFQPVRPVLSVHQNNRDHRKICVVDGLVGFAGGLNLSDEYINEKERFGYWKDSAILLRGPAVWSLTVTFLNMWETIRGEIVDYTRYRPDSWPELPTAAGFVQPYMDTPLPTDTISADLHLMMFTKAKRYLYITTPYLVIDETIAAALCVAAKSGVDVRIMTPHIPDKPAVFAVTQSHYEGLIQAGVRIYEFLPGFIHSKSVVADDLYASVGSCNLDYRSFYLQYENGVWICGDPTVLAIRDDFLTSLEHSQEITLEDCQNTPLLTRLVRSVLRIFSPLF